MILYKNENVLGASIGIGAAKKNILLCDGIKRQKDGYSIVDTCYKDKYSGCDYLSIKILAPAEMKLIRNLNLDSAIIKEIMKEYLDFGLDSTVHNTAFIFPYKEFQNPIYSNLASEVIYKLIKGKKYNEAVLLCHSKNDTYNWFLADGIMYYNKKLNFLKPRQYKFINHFNGKNGFRKFRTNEFGALAYPDIDR